MPGLFIWVIRGQSPNSSDAQLTEFGLCPQITLSPNYLWYEVTRSTSFFDPRITATR
jgi:hypothetical protein